MFEPSVIVAYESLSCPQCEKMDLKIIQSLLERVQIHKKCWKTKEFVGAEGFFLSFQDKQGTVEQLSKKQNNKKTKQNKRQLWIIQVTTQN